MIKRYYQTIKNLKQGQILYRLYYSLNKMNKKRFISFSQKKSYPLSIQNGLYEKLSYFEKDTFSFLNQSFTFIEKIDWNYLEYGRLWGYNLNYFEFLLQPDFSKDTGLRLINDYISQYKDIKVGYDSYPISLRNILWIKFLSKNSIKEEKIDSFLFSQYTILQHNLEFHLLGNHLLENAFSLLFGAYYFKDKMMYQKAYKLLKKELNEQILNDGGHFELSPMYHQILLSRLLDCINVLVKNKWVEDDLFGFMSNKASLMLSWLQNITFPSGNIPHLNDSTNGIAPLSKALFEYAKRINVEALWLPLSDSDYRIFTSEKYKCIMDIGGIAPKYQPGHAHADTFNFVLEINEQPVFVDTGCSTYESDALRNFERGTSAHNTVVFGGINSSQTWASHRVGERAKVKIILDTHNQIVAQHNGFNKLGVTHQRSFYTIGTNAIKIVDEVLGNTDIHGVAFFHLDREIADIRIDNNVISLPMCQLILENFEEIRLQQYEQSTGFNQRVEAKCICVQFRNKLTSIIEF